jgi:hypothetical protein
MKKPMPQNIMELALSLSQISADKVAEMEKFCLRTRILAINALIESARAGEVGAAFGVVADEVKDFSGQIEQVVNDFRTVIDYHATEINRLGTEATQDLVRLGGERLADLAMNLIEIIDRNLYERSCDVRWWATDAAVVECCSDPTRVDWASSRLGVILDAYTVYSDLWICGIDGVVLANGRPDLYPQVRGSSVAHAGWFTGARQNPSEGYVVANIQREVRLGERLIATYAAPIRAGGRADGAIIGVIGVFFDWEKQSQVVVDGVRLSEAERHTTRCVIVDAQKRVLAASDRLGVLGETIDFDSCTSIGFQTSETKTVAFALTPGYETYRGMGWYGVIIQRKVT